MLMGYWAEHGYAGLLPGVTNPMVQSQAVNNDISSPAHNAQDTYQGHPANCIADFMQTAGGSTTGQNIATGLSAWTAYVGLSALVSYSGVQSDAFGYTIFKNSIDAGRPMLLNLSTVLTGDLKGHTVLAYGYQDNMFNLTIRTGSGHQIISVPGFAVMDTWENGVGPGRQAEWKNSSGATIYGLRDSNGVEWWPFLDLTMSYGYDFSNLWDWEIFSGVFYAPVTTHMPVPPTLVLLGSGLLVLLKRRPKTG